MLDLVELIEEDFEIFNHIANGCGVAYIRGQTEREYFVANFESGDVLVHKVLSQAERTARYRISASFLMIRIALSKGTSRK